MRLCHVMLGKCRLAASLEAHNMTVLNQELSTVGGSSTSGDISARLRAVSERERGHGRIAAWHSRGVATDGERGRGGGGWLWGFEHAFFGALPQGRARTQRSNATPRAEQLWRLLQGRGGGAFLVVGLCCGARECQPAASVRGNRAYAEAPGSSAPPPANSFRKCASTARIS